MSKFGFQDSRIWQLAIQIADELFDKADDFEQKRLYRFAEQLGGSGMPMSNNIAGAPGSFSKEEFREFLNIARRSTLETAIMLILLERRKLIGKASSENYLSQLDSLCCQITSFQKYLRQYLFDSMLYALCSLRYLITHNRSTIERNEPSP